jgi:hypothetical protein
MPRLGQPFPYHKAFQPWYAFIEGFINLIELFLNSFFGYG